MAELKKKGIYLCYELVGAGNPTFLRKVAEKYGVMEQVHFLGLKLHDEIWEWLDTIDIYAQPSKQEGLPRAVIEAMNRGCMTIGSDVAGIPELLEPDTVFMRDNVGQICEVIERLIKEKDHEGRIRRNFIKSRDFEVGLLNERRNKLFCNYKKTIKLNENR